MTSVIEKKPIQWRCYGCKNVIAVFDSFEKVENYLVRLMEMDYIKCKKCRRLNNFYVLDGKMIFKGALDLAKENKRLSEEMSNKAEDKPKK